MIPVNYFNSDRYDTTIDKNPSFCSRLYYNNRILFSGAFIRVVFWSKRLAQRGVYDDHKWVEASHFTLDFVERAGGIFHIEGINNIDKVDEPVVFICNHMSILETFILPCIIAPRKKVTYVVKKELVENPLFKDTMLSRNPIVVGRTDPREDFEMVMTKGEELLKSGTSVIVFPQSTRSQTIVPEHFNSIGVKLARKAGVKVIPIALKTDFWKKSKILKEIGPIDVNQPIYFKIGEPMSIEGNGKKNNEQIIQFIQSNLSVWNQDVINKR